MQNSHLKALQDKHEKLEREIRDERVHAAHDELLVEKMKPPPGIPCRSA